MEPSYQLLDSGDFKKLESVGGYLLERPSPQAVWRPRDPRMWTGIHARFERHADGNGQWHFQQKLPEPWTIGTSFGAMTMKATSFGHIGIFPEQQPNWNKLAKIIESRQNPAEELRVLNLFGYTGGATLAAAKAGAHVTHVDASKTTVSWARENAEASLLAVAPIRWIVDDALKFAEREVRREKTYHGIIFDPPSYGRGSKGETWKIETDFPKLLDVLQKLLVPDFAFVLASSHSQGYTPKALENLLGDYFEGNSTSGEMLVPENTGSRVLPSGAYCMVQR